MITQEVPYKDTDPLTVAMGVCMQGLRLTIPKDTPQELQRLMKQTWEQDPAKRPNFTQILAALTAYHKSLC